MTNYDIFSKFYDQVMGDRIAEAEFIHKIILDYHSEAKSILEIACGTGAVLEFFLNKKYKVTGLDFSKKMLEIAEKRISKAAIVEDDMRNFQLVNKFDVILCLFDSINHLLEFKDWQKVFNNAKNHLNPGGLFIFDINTEAKIEYLSNDSQIVKKFNDNYLIMDISAGKKGIAIWDIKIFEKQKKDIFKLFHEVIEERSFPLDRITRSLKKIYSKVIFFDSYREQPSNQTKRVYFVCQNLEN